MNNIVWLLLSIWKYAMNRCLACFIFTFLFFCASGFAPLEDTLRQEKPAETESPKLKVKTELMEVQVVVTDSDGRIVENLKTEGLAQPKNKGYRFSRRLALDPGVYQVRVGVREEGSERVGTAATWVEVSELKQDKLEMSSLVLCNPLDAGLFDDENIQVNELEQVKMVQGVPIYETGDIFYYSFCVHAGIPAPEQSGLLWMREVLQGGMPVVEGTWQTIPAKTMAADGRGWFDLDDELDISEYKAGVYELRVSIKDAASDDMVTRMVAFGIE